MENQHDLNPPAQCPVCRSRLAITRLECVSCSTEVTGTFTPGRLATTPEPYASLLEMFLRVRGNVKEMERELGLSYPTVRARLDEAFEAAGYGRASDRPESIGAEAGLGAELSDRILRHVHQGLAGVEHQLANIDMRAGSVMHGIGGISTAHARKAILDKLESGDLSPVEATQQLRALKERTQ